MEKICVIYKMTVTKNLSNALYFFKISIDNKELDCAKEFEDILIDMFEIHGNHKYKIYKDRFKKYQKKLEKIKNNP